MITKKTSSISPHVPSPRRQPTSALQKRKPHEADHSEGQPRHGEGRYVRRERLQDGERDPGYGLRGLRREPVGRHEVRPVLEPGGLARGVELAGGAAEQEDRYDHHFERERQGEEPRHRTPPHPCAYLHHRVHPFVAWHATVRALGPT
jgi:hypothetical protein